MLETIFTNAILAGVALGFCVALLNKVGIIPVIRFKSLFTAFIILTIVITIALAID